MTSSSSNQASQAPPAVPQFYDKVYDLVRSSDAFSEALEKENHDRERAILRVIRHVVSSLDHASEAPASPQSSSPQRLCAHQANGCCLTLPCAITFPTDPSKPETVGTLYFGFDGKVKIREESPRNDVFNPDKWTKAGKSDLLESKLNDEGEYDAVPFPPRVPEQSGDGPQPVASPSTSHTNLLQLAPLPIPVQAVPLPVPVQPLVQPFLPQPQAGSQFNGSPRPLRRSYAFCEPHVAPREDDPPRYPTPPTPQNITERNWYFFEEENLPELDVPFRRFIITTARGDEPANSTTGVPANTNAAMAQPQNFFSKMFSYVTGPPAASADGQTLGAASTSAKGKKSQPKSKRPQTGKKRTREEDHEDEAEKEERPARKLRRGERMPSTLEEFIPTPTPMAAGPSRLAIAAAPANADAQPPRRSSRLARHTPTGQNVDSASVARHCKGINSKK